MGLTNYITNKVCKFPYYIIMPRTDKHRANYILRDTIFNKFDMNIIESCGILKMIGYLPASIDEFLCGWPSSSNRYEVDNKYEIIYVFEDTIDGSFIENIKKIEFGCIFIMEDINDNVVNKIRNATNMPIVSCGKSYKDTIDFDNKTMEKIHIYWHEIIKKFNENLGLNVNNKLVIGDKTQIPSISAPSIKFIHPLSMVINRLRGIYNSCDQNVYIVDAVNGDTIEIREREASEWINKLLKRLICEKFLVLILGLIEENSINNRDKKYIDSLGVKEEDIFKLLKNKEGNLYERLVNIILSNFENLEFKTDMVICIPSVNSYTVNYINKKLGKNGIPKKILRKIYNSNKYYTTIEDRDVNGGTDEKEAINIKQLIHLFHERAKEITTLTYLSTVYAIAKRLPYIRTNNIPSFEIYQISDVMSKYSKDMEKRNKVHDFNNGMDKICSEIVRYLNDDMLKIIKKHGNHIKLISDLPLEWLKIDSLPLCIEKSISRIPITPGNGLISHSYVNREFELSKDNIKIIIVNTLKPEDGIFNIGKRLHGILNVFLDKIDTNAAYFEAKNKDEFINIIETQKPTILIYYGHGEYNINDNRGKLLIRDEKIEATEIGNLKWRPVITILGACETQVLHGTHLNTANMFVGTGVTSVLGAYFPIDAFHAATFVSGLIRNLSNCLAGVAPQGYKSWADIILTTYRSHYLLDPIISLHEYVRKKNIKVNNNLLKNAINLFYKICDKRNIPFMEIYKLRDDIFLEVFEEDNLLYDAYKKILDRKLIIPQSLFYCSLGSPEIITIKREKVEYSLDEIDKLYLREIEYLIKTSVSNPLF